MKEMHSGYIDLIVVVTRCERDDVLPLNEKDAEEIDALLDSLPNGRQSQCSLAEAMSLRFGLKGKQKHTLKAAGESANVSSAAIHTKEVVALRRLQHPSRIKHLRKFSRTYLEDRLKSEAVLRQRNSILIEENEKLEEENGKLRQIIHQIHTLIAPVMPSTMPLSEVEVVPSDVGVDELELSVRAFYCLKNSGIRTLGELIQMRETDLLKMKNFGRKSLREIKEILSEKGLALRS